MEKYLTKTSKRLILDVEKLKIRLPFKLNEKFIVLRPYFIKFIDKYRELNNVLDSVKDFKKDIIKSKKINIPCNTLNILNYIRKNKTVLDDIYNTCDFSLDEIKKTSEFLNSYDKYNFEKCILWMNNHGEKINRGIYNLLKQSKIPGLFLKKMHIPTLEIYGEFTSLDVRDYVEKYINSSISFVVEIKGIKLNLNIKTRDHVKEERLIKLIKRCLILSHYHNLKDVVNIEFLETKNKKILPKRNTSKLLGPKEINSGSTYQSMNDSHVCVWREEESPKLILHELVHYLDIDFRFDTKQFDSLISRYFNINPDTQKKLYEAYTETCACIINIFTCSLECCDNQHSYKYAKKMFNYELKYSLFQVAKILNFYSFKNINEFVKPYDSKNKFKQSTSVFSYFFVKTALLFYLDEFIDFIKKNNDKNVDYSFKLSDSYNVPKNFLIFILDICKRREYLEIINSIMIKLKSLKKTRKNNYRLPKLSKTTQNTLRMTCVEIK